MTWGSSIPLVLHIEDDDSDARMVARSFSKAQCPARIERAVDGRQALGIVDSIADRSHERPELVLLDLKLPFSSGLEVLQRARSYSNLTTIPIVVLTSSDVEEDRRACMECGCTEYVVKPIDYFAFLSTLKDLCDRYFSSEQS